ncbi:hypothetical protein F5X96DRAFT_677279 [Biscogniauxia mediterranea]|nr:hypothetical protein F5X96DRAFT_677279 [Biscogniauxia mediterranea]
MELCSRAIEEVVHPTAAFFRSPNEERETPGTPNGEPQTSWGSSLLNPKNRVDSLEFPNDPLWRVDGCAGLGTQYFIVPLFLSHVPPMRMDVFIPENQPALIREQLELDIAFHTKDATRLSRLAITRHIIRTLQNWTRKEFEDLDAFERFYTTVPFGSRIVFENLSLDISQIHIRLGYNHDLERQLLSLRGLETLWGSIVSSVPVIDLLDLHVVAVLHDSVCLVRIHGDLFIFKALISEAKYLYHELRTLCTLQPHPNIIARPIHIVQKTCNFGGKRAIAGFTTFYHPKGSLRDLLPRLRIHGQLQLSDQLKWSTQVTMALEHLQTREATYYPDLRLDNIVLSEQSDIIMIDFEQRGVWCEFAPPEVNAIEFMRLIATDERMPVREKYLRRLEGLLPSFEALQGNLYMNPEEGYNVSWIALSSAEQEAAEVYMLGRLLWCIFEGVSGPQKAAVWQSYRWESDLEFPEYSRTPRIMRDLIDRCTRGRRETLASVIIRQHSQLILRSKPVEEQTSEDVKEAARLYWQSEIKAAEDFLDMRDAMRSEGTWNENYYNRPTLKEVLASLKAFQEQA